MSKKMMRSVASVVIVATGLTGVGATNAGASTPSGAAQVQSANVQVTADQWRDIARNASANGDRSMAQAAQQQADRSAGGVGTMAWGAVAKQAIKAALTHGRSYLPANMRPYADQIYSLIDTWESTTETAITTSLVANGVPADVAQTTAQWVSTFL